MKATLAGLGVGGAVGGVVGALVGMGIPEYEAKRCEGRVKEGGILVSVHCDSSEEVSCAKELLERAGGEDVVWAGREVGEQPHCGQRSRYGGFKSDALNLPDQGAAFKEVETVRTKDEIIDADTGRRRTV